MKNTPVFSVIICNYNYAGFVCESINSVLSQGFEDFELIVVDDGSEDDSLEQINSFSDARLNVISQENAGQASAFNAGYKASCGEIVCFLDSDDWWAVDKLETLSQWNCIFSPETALIQHQLAVWDNGHESPYKHTLPIGDCFADMCATGRINYFVPTSGLAIPRRICERVFPVPEEIRIGADAFLTRTAFTYGDVVSIPRALGYYRKHNNAVFENADFKASVFFKTVLFPALDNYYKAHEIDSDRFAPNYLFVKTKKNLQEFGFNFVKLLNKMWKKLVRSHLH